MMLTNRPKKQILFLGVIGLINYLLLYGVSSFIAQHTIPEEFGDYQVTLRVLVFLSNIMLLGDDSTTLQYTAQYHNSINLSQERNLLRWLLKRFLISSAVVLILGGFFLLVHSSFLDIEITRLFDYHPSHIVLLYAPLAALLVMISQYLLAHHQLLSSLLPTNILSPLLFFATIFYLTYQNDSLSVNDLVLIFLVIQFLMLTFSVTVSIVRARRILNSHQISIPESNQWHSSSFSSWLNGLTFQINTALTLFLVELFGQEYHVGLYSSIMIINSIFFVITNPIQVSLYPYIAKLIDTDTLALNKKMKDTNSQMNALMLLALGLLLAFAHPLLNFFHESYIEAKSALIVGAILSAMVNTLSPAFNTLCFSKYNYLPFQLQMIRIIISICLIYILLPKYGLLGAVIGDLAPSIIINVFAVYICKYQLHLKTTLIA